MTEKKSILPMMAVTVIVTAAIAVGATLAVIHMSEQEQTEDPEQHVWFEQTSYGAYATYTMRADCEGTVKASDGGQFVVDGETVNTFNFIKDKEYTLTFYGGATPDVKI